MRIPYIFDGTGFAESMLGLEGFRVLDVVEDPVRVGQITKLGVDETSFRAAGRERRTGYVTAVVDLDRRVVADVVEGRKGSDLREWLRVKGSDWRRAVKVVATDMTGSYRAGSMSLLWWCDFVAGSTFG